MKKQNKEVFCTMSALDVELMYSHLQQASIIQNDVFNILRNEYGMFFLKNKDVIQVNSFIMYDMDRLDYDVTFHINDKDFMGCTADETYDWTYESDRDELCRRLASENDFHRLGAVTLWSEYDCDTPAYIEFEDAYIPFNREFDNENELDSVGDIMTELL